MVVSKKNKYGITERNAWKGMKARCYNSKDPGFKNYGGRGIFVCDEWKNNFDAFLNHIGMKPSPELSLDRIDPNGSYVPGNVRWATSREQNINQRRILRPIINGIEYDCVKSACKAVGISPAAVWQRREERGMTTLEAITSKRMHRRGNGPKSSKPIIVNGTVYKSVAYAALCLGVDRKKVRKIGMFV